MLKKVKKILKKKSKEVKKKIKKKKKNQRHQCRNRCRPFEKQGTGYVTSAITLSLTSTPVPSNTRAPHHHCKTPCLAHHPHLPVSSTHHPNTCHAPSNTTHNTGAHTGAFPSSTCEMKSEGKYGNVLVSLSNLLILWRMKKIGYPSNPHSLIRLNSCNRTLQCSSIHAR